MFKIAIDTGGTFTDYTLSAGKTGRNLFIKTPTDHQDPTQGILFGLHELAKAVGTDLTGLLAQTEKISHGTTLSLNALLEQKGVKTALLTTEGFRDALEIRRASLNNQWDLRAQNPPLLVPRYLRIGIEERLDYQGNVVTPISEQSLLSACDKLRKENVRAVAVCFLFSFVNPSHERFAAQIIRRELPDVFVSLSSEIAPRIREFERTTTTVLNAYLTPVLSDYLKKIQDGLSRFGWVRPIHIMANNGGLTDTVSVSNNAVKTLLSGPAGGACGNEMIAKQTNTDHIIMADMGGTSFDLHLVQKGRRELVPDNSLSGYPLHMPMIDIHSIGAGGGSIALIDEGGRIRVGPKSAGSVPGPACYQLGGIHPTVTDAALVLGLLSEEHLMGGTIRLNREKAEAAIRSFIAEPLGLNVTEGARLIYRIAAENMADALRLVTMQKGNDPRIFSLLSAGGAFPLFAANIIKRLHMPETLIPLQSPVFCSWGMLGAQCRTDTAASILMEQEHFDASLLREKITALKHKANHELKRLRIKATEREYDITFEMRYIGQHHQISISADEVDLTEKSLDIKFNNKHDSIYGYAEQEQPWEIIDIHLSAAEQKRIDTIVMTSEECYDAPTKRIADGDPFLCEGSIEIDVYQGDPMNTITYGPCLIELSHTTIIVPDGAAYHRDKNGIARIRFEEKNHGTNN